MNHYVRRATEFYTWDICSIEKYVKAADTLDYDKIKDTLDSMPIAVPILSCVMVLSGLVCLVAPCTSLVKCFLVG